MPDTTTGTAPKANGGTVANLRFNSAPTREQLLARIVELEAQSAAKVRIKVSEKGGVMLTGIRRFPVTFYKQEWETMLDMADAIRQFIKQHNGELSQGKAA